MNILTLAQSISKQAKLNKAKQSVNYGRKPGSSGSVDTRDYSSPYVHQQNSNQDFSLNSEGILSLPGSSPTTPTGSANMIPPDPSSLVNPFSGKAQDRINSIYGNTSQRQQSLANPPLFFEDQTGDGKITRADVIKARTEGYKK